MQLWVCRLQVIELDWFAQQLFVEGEREAPIDVVTMKNCKAHHPTHKVKIRQVVLKEGDTEKERQRIRFHLFRNVSLCVCVCVCVYSQG